MFRPGKFSSKARRAFSVGRPSAAKPVRKRSAAKPAHRRKRQNTVRSTKKKMETPGPAKNIVDDNPFHAPGPVGKSEELKSAIQVDEFNLVMKQHDSESDDDWGCWKAKPEPSAAKPEPSCKAGASLQSRSLPSCCWCNKRADAIVNKPAIMLFCAKCEATVCPFFQDFACNCDVSELPEEPAPVGPGHATSESARQIPPPPPPPLHDPNLSVWASFEARRAAQGKWIPARPSRIRIRCGPGSLKALGWSAPPLPCARGELANGWNPPPLSVPL